jgi:hypothetical protein
LSVLSRSLKGLPGNKAVKRPAIAKGAGRSGESGAAKIGKAAKGKAEGAAIKKRRSQQSPWP